MLGDDLATFRFAGGDWRVGVTGGYLHDSFRLSQLASSGSVESILGGVYMGVNFGNLRLNAGALYGTNTNATTRTVNIGDVAFAHFGGETWAAFGQAGYRFTFSQPSLNAFGISVANVEPFIGAAAIDVRSSTANEEGSTAALTGFGKSFVVDSTTLGARTALAFTFTPDLPIFFNGALGWQHAFGNLSPTTLAAVQGNLQSTSVVSGGVPIARNALVTQVGLNYRVKPTIKVGVTYTGQYSGHAYDNAFNANLHIDF